MLIFLPISLLILTSIILAVLRLLNPKSGVSWLVSAALTLLTWLIVMLMRLRIPESFTLGSTRSFVTLPFQYSLLLDKISWPYAWALSTSLLAFILVSATRLSSDNTLRPTWSFWPINLLIGGLGLWSIFSGNLNSLILSWAAIDLIWLFFVLSTSYDHQAALITFALRIAGLFLAIGATYLRTPDESVIFPAINSTINTLLFLGALTRLVSISLSGKLASPGTPDQTINPFFNMVVAATGLIIITRSSISIDDKMIPILFGITAGLGFLCGIVWLFTSRARNDLSAWLVGISALGAAAAVQGETQASLSWGLVLILIGSYFQYYTARIRLATLLLSVAFIGISTLPFTSAWQGVRLYPLPNELFMHGAGWIVILLAQTMLLVGFVQALLPSRKPVSGAERWVWVVFPIGLTIPLLTQIIILIFGLPGLSNDLQAFPPLALSWASLLIVVLALAGFWIIRIRQGRWQRLQNHFETVTLYEWGYSAIKSVFRLTSLLVGFLNKILESEGGILWTILLLILMLALFLQLGFGG